MCTRSRQQLMVFTRMCESVLPKSSIIGWVLGDEQLEKAMPLADTSGAMETVVADDVALKVATSAARVRHAYEVVPFAWPR